VQRRPLVGHRHDGSHGAQCALDMAAVEVVFAPVNHCEVMWRAQRILALAREQLRVGRLVVNLTARVVQIDDRIAVLSAHEYRLIAYFTRRCGRVIACEELLSEVWGCNSEEGGTRDQVKCCLMRLRKKIERDSRNPEYLVSVTGLGYLLRNQEQWRQAQLAELRETNTDLTLF